MGKQVDLDDLVDAMEVADLLGLSHRNTVSIYQKRYPEMPRPVIEFGGNRCKLWLKSEILVWNESRQRKT